jgi:hypothetical protein
MARVESTGVRAVGVTGGFKYVLRAGACVAALALADAPAATTPVDAAACQIVL